MVLAFGMFFYTYNTEKAVLNFKTTLNWFQKSSSVVMFLESFVAFVQFFDAY